MYRACVDRNLLMIRRDWMVVGVLADNETLPMSCRFWDKPDNCVRRSTWSNAAYTLQGGPTVDCAAILLSGWSKNRMLTNFNDVTVVFMHIYQKRTRTKMWNVI